MLVSYNWLKQYVDLPDSLDPEELGLKLTMSTVEVEETKKQGEGLDGVVVGEILKIEKHPDADKLSVAKIDVGESSPRQIVFGQMVEMEVGFKIPVALAPTVLPGNKEIKKSKLRGVVSEGMLCLDQEMGLAEEGVSIRFFDKEMKNGTPIAKALNLDDTVFDIDNKSMTHRPDLWGHYGIAREVASLENKKLKNLEIKELKESKEVDLKINIEDKENCTRYIGAVVGGIKIEPSPEWLQKRLLAVGLRPINNIVDITNYVTLELGRPSHAFDRRDIAKDTIVVRRAKKGEKFTTLDGQSRIMTDQMCLVCDAERPVDLGGIMGGENSEIKEDTTEIILELANFKAANIRRTSQAFGLRTDAGVRFEKGLSPHLAELGMQRILTLIKQVIPSAHLMSKIVDVNNEKKENREIELDLAFLNMKVGQEISKKEVIKILESLGFSTKDKKDKLLVTVPIWRSTKDVSIPEDLIEEVARIYGYNKVEACLPKFLTTPPARNELRLLERKIKNILSLENGYTETYNYSFVSPVLLKKLGMGTKEHIELDNPIAKDRPFLRRSLLPNLLENVEKNLHYTDNLKLFEIGKIFDKNKKGARTQENSDELLPRQDVMLGLVCSAKGDKVPFYEVSGVLSNLLNNLGVEYELRPAIKVLEHVHPGRQAEIFVGDELLGFVVDLQPSYQMDLGIDSRVGLMELNLNKLLTIMVEKSKYEKMPLYPAIERDVAFVVDKSVVHKDIVENLIKQDELVRSVELFDIFEGGKIGEGKKSMAYHIVYRDDKKTLESADVDKIHTKLIKKLEKEFGAEVRK
jgi:phenylalanyl-tRNA synthetase beta chain